MRSRPTAEWVTFGLASAVVAAVVALILVQMLGPEAPADPRATVTGPAVRSGDQFFVPVEVRNAGDATAESVQVAAELEIGNESVEADQVVDFLAGGETERLQFVFDEDPSLGMLTVRVTGYAIP